MATKLRKIKIEIADTPYSQQQGLMFRDSMEDDHGMLFVFKNKDKLRFWNLNTFLPLDVAFIDDGGIIKNIEYLPSYKNLSTIESHGKCKMALEVNAGFFSKNDISPGDRIKINKDIVEFDKMIKMAQGIVEENNIETVDPEKISKETEEEKSKDEPLEYMTPRMDLVEKYPKFNNQFDAINWAINNLEVMRIKYVTMKGITLVRDIEPHYLYKSKSTNRTVIIAYDRTVNGIRSFIMTNIKEFSFLGDIFNKKFNIKY